MMQVKFLEHDNETVSVDLLDRNSDLGLPLFALRSLHWYELLLLDGDKRHPCLHVIRIKELDFATILRGLHWFANPTDPLLRRAAILHDDLYKYKGLLANGYRLTRAQVDDLFLAIARSKRTEGKGFINRWVEKGKEGLAWAFVRSLGYFAWRKG